eukprot:gene3876-biopygen3773
MLLPIRPAPTSHCTPAQPSFRCISQSPSCLSTSLLGQGPSYLGSSCYPTSLLGQAPRHLATSLSSPSPTQPLPSPCPAPASRCTPAQPRSR